MTLFLTTAITSVGVPQGLSAESDALISVDFDAVALRDALKILSQQSGLNFVANQEAEAKKVTLFLENVPVNEAFEAIVSANGLRYEKKGGVYVVYAQGEGDTAKPLQTRIYKIRFARFSISPMDIGSKSTVLDLLLPEEVNAVRSGQQSSAAGSGEGEGDSGGGDEKESNLTAERGIDKIISSVLSEDGRMAVDIATNSLIVTDNAETHIEVEKVLSRVDIPPKQVMIDVQLLEVNKAILGDYGVDWGTSTGALASFAPGARSTQFPFNMFYNSEGLRPDQIYDPITDAIGGATVLRGVLSAAEASPVLHYLTNQQDTKILARPRVMTLNNEAANIKLLTKTVTGTKSTLVTSQSLTTFTVGEAVTDNSGITLKMTPQINDDETISLFVEPSITTIANSGFFPSQFLEPTTRSVRTAARVKNHDTLILGGLIDNNELVTTKKVPMLGDLPLIGQAFRYDDSTKRDREFLVFITPHIVRGYDSLADDSATTVGREVIAHRLLNAFAEREVNAALPTIERETDEALPAHIQERLLVERSAERAVPAPATDAEMSRTMDSFSGQTTVNYVPRRRT